MHEAHSHAEPRLNGCPWHDVNEMLQSVGLRPTRQRMALGWLLFGKGDRHLTAEMLYEEASQAKVPVSLATVYNTLNQLTDVGLLRQVSVDGTKTYFDTNVRVGAPALLPRKQPRADRHSECRTRTEGDAGRSRGLRDCPGRRRRASAKEGLRAVFRVILGEGYGPSAACPRAFLRALAGLTHRPRGQSVDLLVGVNAPQLQFLDPAVKAAPDDPAPFHVAALDLGHHAGL